MESQQMASYLLAMVTIAVSVTVCKIITFILPKWLNSNLCTTHKYVKVISYDVADYDDGWLFLWPIRWLKSG